MHHVKRERLMYGEIASQTVLLAVFGKQLDRTHWQAKWYSNSLNCIMLIETTHLTQVE